MPHRSAFDYEFDPENRLAIDAMLAKSFNVPDFDSVTGCTVAVVGLASAYKTMYEITLDALSTQNVAIDVDAACVGGLITKLVQPTSFLDLIDEVCSDPTNLEENEQAPSAKAIKDIKRIINDAQSLSSREIIAGDIAPYFGEVSITWRNGGQMLRATSFPDSRQPRLDFGTTPEGALGEYGFEENATGESLAKKLSLLFPNCG